MSRLEQLLAGTLAVIALLVLAALAGHHVGAVGVQAKWDREKLARVGAQERAVLAAVTKNEAERQKDLAAARITIANYEKALHESEDRITAERAAADRQRLRITVPKRDCAAPAGEAAGAARADAGGAEETVDLPESIERGLRDLAEAADRETERLVAKVGALQDWIRSHGFYDQAP